ncbi:hypothetical protein U1Q18_004136 [Sarracenia purpurea var. burkii]
MVATVGLSPPKGDFQASAQQPSAFIFGTAVRPPLFSDLVQRMGSVFFPCYAPLERGSDFRHSCEVQGVTSMRETTILCFHLQRRQIRKFVQRVRTIFQVLAELMTAANETTLKSYAREGPCQIWALRSSRSSLSVPDRRRLERKSATPTESPFMG